MGGYAGSLDGSIQAGGVSFLMQRRPNYRLRLFPWGLFFFISEDVLDRYPELHGGMLSFSDCDYMPGYKKCFEWIPAK